MTTLAEVRADVASRLAGALPAIDFRYPNGTIAMPEEPTTFVYVEVLTDRPEIVGFGGGRGGNLQRTTGRIEAHVMVPSGSGTVTADELAEQICAVFRGTRLNGLSVFACVPRPTPDKTEDGAYARICTAEIEISFDQAA